MTGLRTKSLRLRIASYVFATSVLIILLLGMIVFFQITALINTVSQENLLDQAQKIASAIEYDWRGRLDLDLSRRSKDYYSEKSTNHQYAVTNASGKPLFKSDNFMEEQIKPALDNAGKFYFDFQTDDGKVYTGLKYDYLFDGKIYPIFVIENEKVFSLFLTTLQDKFLSKLLIYGAPLLILQGLVIVMLLRGFLTPVLQASKEARNITYSNLSYRLSEEHIPSEILPLIQSINKSLARLENSAEAQKFFIANAAHELRTPISILKARIASLKNEKEIYMLNEDLRSINRLISQLLDVSRLDLAEQAPMKEVSLNDISQRACEDMGALFVTQNKELSLEQKANRQIVNGNEDTLLRAVLNLLENALKHTPEKTPVHVIVDNKKIIVRDYGSPIPEKQKAKLFERFEKMPESMNNKGSGLGLSIVKKAMEIHGGAVSIKSRKDGNDFVLDFS